MHCLYTHMYAISIYKTNKRGIYKDQNITMLEGVRKEKNSEK